MCLKADRNSLSQASDSESLFLLNFVFFLSSQANANSYDDELLELLISHGLTAEVAQTPFLTPLISFVVSHPDGHTDTQSDDTAASQPGARVRLVASQLQAAGHWAEAGTLMLNYHGTHPALRTFDSAVGALSRWLRR